MHPSAHYFGLTGSIACGKSTVAAMLKELGAKIIDADKVGHEFLLVTSPVFHEIVEAFGRDILDGRGEIDRRKLGPLVFAQPDKLRQLNAIVHPRIIERVEQMAEDYRRADPDAVIFADAALIYESGIGGRFSKVVVAWCRPEQQLERLMAKTGLSREEAQKRISSQLPAEEKRRRADFVIDCSGSLEETRRQVEELFPKLAQISRQK